MLALTSKKEAKYILQVGEEGSPRLDLLHELHSKYSQQYISTLKISPTATILDIGCGVGNMTCWLAKKFPNSKIVGLDNSVEQLNLARKRADENRLTNIEYLLDDLENLSIAAGKFDVVYSRYSIIHVRNSKEVLRRIILSLKPQGCLILEEPTISSGFCYPTDYHYEKSRMLLDELSKILGYDFDIGKKLENILFSLGLKIISKNLIQPVLATEQEKKLLAMLTLECRDAYFLHQLITESDFKDMIIGLENLTNQEGVLIGFPRTTQICAVIDN